MNQEEKMALLEDLFEVDAGTITADMVLDDFDWDSMTMLALIVIMKDNFDKSLDGDTLRGFVTVGDVLKEME